LEYNSFSAKVTAKVTAELLPLNDSDAHVALHLIGTFHAKGRAMHHQQTFGIWLRQRRKALDLTQAQLAQQAGCSLSAIRQFERSVLRPSRRLTEQPNRQCPSACHLLQARRCRAERGNAICNGKRSW
jgi:DNA-binding XRE family transcriptional regulator